MRVQFLVSCESICQNQKTKKGKKPSIQDRIRLWISNLRIEHKIFLLVVGGIGFFYCYIYIFMRSIIFQFLAEFTAGFLGILIGFSLDRYVELGKKVRISKQIINSLLAELNSNLNSVKKFKSEIKIPRSYRISPSSPLGYRLSFFGLFQTSAWNIFSSRLELEAVETLFELGAIYHKFQLFNEAMKNESTGGTLVIFLRKNPKFLEKLEKDLEKIIELLNSLELEKKGKIKS